MVVVEKGTAAPLLMALGMIPMNHLHLEMCGQMDCHLPCFRNGEGEWSRSDGAFLMRQFGRKPVPCAELVRSGYGHPLGT